MNVSPVRSGRRGRPRNARVVGWLYSTCYRFGDISVLRLESDNHDLFGCDSIFVVPGASSSSWVLDDLAHGYNPQVVFSTPGKVSNLRVVNIVDGSEDLIPVYSGSVRPYL